MIDQIISQGKEFLSGKLKETVGFDESQIDTALNTAKDSTVDTLKDEVKGGNLSGVLDLFNGKSDTSTSNPIVGGMANNLISGLVSKLGIGKDMASKATDMIIPFIMSKFSSTDTGQAKDGSELMDMLGGGGLKDALGGLLGGDKGGKDDGMLGKLGKFF